MLKHIGMTKPCDDCPFRYDVGGYLSKDRREELVSNLLKGDSFNCHKTLDYSLENESKYTSNSQHCGGAFAVLTKEKKYNNVMSLAQRLGFRNFENDMSLENTFDSLNDFINDISNQSEVK